MDAIGQDAPNPKERVFSRPSKARAGMKVLLSGCGSVLGNCAPAIRGSIEIAPRGCDRAGPH